MTFEPASAALACLVQARPRVAVPSLPWSRVQPAGFAMVPLIELVDRNSTRVSPACTVAGTCTTWLARLPWLLPAATKDSVAAGALLGVAVRVVWTLVVPSLTVSVTVLLPAVV